MASHNTGDSSRKPSGSSTHSVAHSPSGSPSHVQRKLTPGGPGNMFGVGGAGGLKSLNGWVWNSSTPTSTRNASISSAASVAELSSSQGDPAYRANLGESWTTPRSTSGTWEDVNGSPQKGPSQLDPHNSLSLHHARQRQAAAAQAAALSAPRIDERSPGSKSGQFSPQRYETGLGKETGVRYSSAASPTRPSHYGSNAFSNQHGGLQGSNPSGGYDNLQTSSMVENELTMGLRGMAVEDDYSGAQNPSYRQPPLLQQTPSHGPTIPQVRVPPQIQQPRAPYGVYPGHDYTAYYNNPPTREAYVDYQYGYGTADPSLYGSSAATSPASLYPGAPQSLHPGVADMHRQQYYDYTGAARPPASQYYYPTQAMLYPPPSHSPMMTPQLASASPVNLSDKKRDVQYNLQQQMGGQNIMYPSLRSTPSPHAPAYGASLEYPSQLPIILPGGAVYSHGLAPGMHAYGQNMRPGRRDNVDPSVALRSPLLDEFRANKTRKWELRDIFNFVVEFSGDQHGSRFIQQKLESATSEEKQVIFDEIVPNNSLQLIQDVFGNYVIQKLFEHGTQVQKAMLASTMEGHILPLSLQMYGCRVVQKAIEFILPEQQGAFVKELDSHVLKCVKDANGNHVIQKLIERVSPDRLGFVNSFRNNVYDLATHPYGCRVLQRCFEHLPDDYTRPLLDELQKYTINLMQDQFGNYVIQFVLEHGKPQDRAVVINKLRGQMLQMARHKFASNVCEKALITADPESRRVLIDEIMTPKQDGVSPIVTMMKDQFANYVLQRALAVVEGEQKELLISKVRPQLVSMRRYSSAYSKHLVSIERLLEKCASPQKSADTSITSIHSA